jgi:hypothetical protein
MAEGEVLAERASVLPGREAGTFRKAQEIFRD